MTSLRLAPLFLCLLLAAGAVFAQAVYPPLTGRVVDRAQLLTPAEEARLTDKLAAHEQATGEQVVVATIPSLKGENLEQYSLELARRWGIGSKERNDGVLFLVAHNDRKLRIEVGYGLEGRLTDFATSVIIRHDIVPFFKQGQFAPGIERGVDQILRYLTASAEERGAWEESQDDDRAPIWPFVVFVVIWFAIFFGSFILSWLIRRFGRKIKPGHYRWLGMDAGPYAPRRKRGKGHRRRSTGSTGTGWSGGGGGWSGGGGFSGGGGSFGGGGSSGSW